MALEKLSHFILQVNDPVLISGRAGYSGKAHRYKRSFVNPRGYKFWLDARVGINAYRARRLAALKPTQPTPRDGLDVEDWLNRRRDEIAPDPNLPPIVPDFVEAYVWTVNEVGGAFNKREIIKRPVQPLWVCDFTVPHPGTYDVELRVVTNDNRFFERTIRVTFKALLMATMGDSSASGEGNPDVEGTADPVRGARFCQWPVLAKVTKQTTVAMSNEPTWLESKAHRSLVSGPGLAAQCLQDNIAFTRRGQIFDLTVIDYVSVARSGAQIINGLLNTQTQPPNLDFIGVSQVDELARTANGRPIDILTINIGGNDAGFAGVLADLVLGDSYFSLGLRTALLNAAAGAAGDSNLGDDAKVRDRMRDRLDALIAAGGQIERNLDLLNTQVELLVPAGGVGNIYLTGYPYWLFDAVDNGKIVFKADGIFSGADLDITPADYTLIKDEGKKLNALLERKANEFGWHYVPPSSEFRGRGYAADNGLWRGATRSCLIQGDFDGTMHPTREGHGAWALEYVKAIKQYSGI